MIAEGGAVDSSDEVVAVAALRRLVRRGWICLVAGLVLAAGFVRLNLAEDDAEALAEYGTRVPGVVIGTHGDRSFRSDSVEVRFTIAGREQLRELNLDQDSPELVEGDQVTMVYDPADPGRIGAIGIRDQSDLVSFLLVVTLFGGFAVSLIGLRDLSRWARRARAVREHGWRRGYGTTVGEIGVRITFADDTSRLVLRTFDSRDFQGSVLLGGAGRSMVVWVHGRLVAVRALR
ncbi:DUF3592 domain-containing protein [Actinokineospora sp. NBRC 105648]|uniref:DUF3592 domain-containing protein n=1 Tax=Actinokineospora sp. NBRC 105648 TaxID=3032206 RepID=UPI0024A0421E|nr:DUF3592 domain-containing protein [Actinokineospora sp. NBRC 105648]GLZ36531.1 hypothetical protein Acsp05_01560 [Actinokineospora sp. NBRC 105648]